MKAEAQAQAEEQPQDLDPEIVHLRRALAEAEVARDRLDMQAGDLTRDLRQTREALDLRNRRILDLEGQTETLVTMLKERADEFEETRLELKNARASLRERNRQVEDLVQHFTAATGRVSELQDALGKMERLGG